MARSVNARRPVPGHYAAQVYAGQAPATPVPGMSLVFVLFLLLNATLFVRPAELVPGLIGWPIFQALLLPCLALALSQLFPQLTRPALQQRPITVCVVALLPVIVLSQLGNLNPLEAADAGFAFGKVVIYYLLFVGLITTPTRLRQFLFYLVLFLIVMAALSVLSYHELISLPNLSALRDGQVDQVTGREVYFQRLRGTGLFGDPNDVCLILVFGMALCVYWAGESRGSFLRYLWVAPLGLFGYALALTQSRGGFLALVAAMLAYFYTRFGKTKTLFLGAVALPLLLAAYGGRQTAVSTGESTAHERIGLWSEGLLMFRSNPLFGVGYGKYDDIAGHVAHNSFLHCYAELGILGGTLFLGAFYFGFRELLRPPLGSEENEVAPQLRRLRPCLAAGMAGFITGMMSLTVSYIMPTYTILGLATAYLGITTAPAVRPAVQFDARLVRQFCGVGLVFLVAMYCFVRLFR